MWKLRYRPTAYLSLCVGKTFGVSKPFGGKRFLTSVIHLEIEPGFPGKSPPLTKEPGILQLFLNDIEISPQKLTKTKKINEDRFYI